MLADTTYRARIDLSNGIAFSVEAPFPVIVIEAATPQEVLTTLGRESKTGCRRCVGCGEIPRVLNGLGVAIVSTSRGVLSDRKCRELHIGGELLCTVH